jgi:hypothetical protein
MHYIMTGAANKGVMTKEELQRFMSKVHKTKMCWIWKAATDTKGYGVFSFRGKQVQAHKLSYKHFIGEIPSGLKLAITCLNKLCVKPGHQKPLSMHEILRLSGIIGRTHCRRGHPFTPENTKRDSHGHRVCLKCYWVKKKIKWRNKELFCKKGHPFAPDNFYTEAHINSKGEKKLWRRCKKCKQEYQLKWYYDRKSPRP